jgi:ubiquinone/menaquinone biosynthesis C-methylase UbiE
MISKDDIKFWGPQYGSIYPYLEVSTPYKNLIRDIFSFLHLSKNDKILDCGSGSGLIVQEILDKYNFVEKIDALDISDVMLNHLKNKLDGQTKLNREKVNLIKHDLSINLPFDNLKYDKIVSNLVLTYIVSHEGKLEEEALSGVLSEIYRVLKKDGVLVWSTPKENVNFIKVFIASWKDILNLRYYKRLYYGPVILGHALAIQKKGREGIYHFFDKQKIEKILVDCGFKNINFKLSFAKQAWVISCQK